MAGKKLNVAGIVNELQGASAFFPHSSQSPTTPPDEEPPRADRPPATTNTQDPQPTTKPVMREPAEIPSPAPVAPIDERAISISQQVDKSTNQQTTLSTSQQINKSSTNQTNKSTSQQVDKSTNQQTDIPIKRFTTYLFSTDIKRMKIIALEENKKDYEIFQEAITAYLQSREEE
jgi:hypothetical protein